LAACELEVDLFGGSWSHVKLGIGLFGGSLWHVNWELIWLREVGGV
jgi:hypothetical protein